MRLIDADHLLNEIEALKKSPWFNQGSNSFDPLMRGRHLAINETVGMVVDLCIKQEPTVEPKLYGYDIEQLAAVAELLRKKHVTPDIVNAFFLDVSSAVKMVLDEISEQSQRVLKDTITGMFSSFNPRGDDNDETD